MKLIAELNDEKFEVLIKQEDDKFFAEIGGRKYEIEASEPEPNVFLFKHEGKIYEIFVSPQKNPDQPLLVRGKENVYEVNVIDPKRLRGSGAAGGDAQGTAEIKTAMPGKIVRILTEVGAEVKKGDGIIVVEAMKMQNEMKSPKDGVVKEIRISEGETVHAGGVLAVIE